LDKATAKLWAQAGQELKAQHLDGRLLAGKLARVDARETVTRTEFLALLDEGKTVHGIKPKAVEKKDEVITRGDACELIYRFVGDK
jgi:hypothetical protein